MLNIDEAAAPGRSIIGSGNTAAVTNQTSRQKYVLGNYILQTLFEVYLIDEESSVEENNNFDDAL